MITCREASRLMSARQDKALGPWQSAALKLHLCGCGDCRQVEQQFEQLDRLTAELLARRAADGAKPPQR